MKKKKTQVPFFVRKGERVAVLDDDAGIRMQWEILLDRAGVKVDSFESWDHYLDVQRKKPHQYGTMIVDFCFNNSQFNGEDILRKLQTVPVDFFYLCTADYLKPEIQQLAQSYNAHLYPKPISNLQIAFVKPKDLELPKGS